MGDVIPFKKPDKRGKSRTNTETSLTDSGKAVPRIPAIQGSEKTYAQAYLDTKPLRMALHEAGFFLMDRNHPQDPATLENVSHAVHDGVMAVTRRHSAEELKRIFNGVRVFLSAPKLEWRVDEGKNNELHVPNTTTTSQIETIVRLHLRN